MRTFRRDEAGEGQLGCIVGILVLVAFFFVAYKMIPIKVKAADLRQTVTDEAKAAGIRNDKLIRENILDKAKELELPVDDNDVKIERFANTIRVDVKYTVVVDFPGYAYNWEFEDKVENPIF